MVKGKGKGRGVTSPWRTWQAHGWAFIWVAWGRGALRGFGRWSGGGDASDAAGGWTGRRSGTCGGSGSRRTRGRGPWKACSPAHVAMQGDAVCNKWTSVELF
jgi:hypothetical protein